MSRLMVLVAATSAAGTALMLADLRWFRRASWVDRIAPYLPGAGRARRPSSGASWATFLDVVAPLAAAGGNRLSRLLGTGEELGLRLERIQAPFTVTTFRMRQLGAALAALAAAALVVVLAGPPPAIALLFLLGAPVLAFLVLEQQVARASSRWQERVRGELPIVTEQLGMLLGAGYSLAGALNRLARRGSGACAADLTRVCGRLRQGLGEQAALVEWAERVDVDGLDRLVSVLALNRQATDLGRLISEEARSMRRDAQRRLIENIERRAQQVWVPVTVAALVPGVLFMVVPFVQAMRLFTTS
jgi:tight adherence protein C